jgi:hypothetical protein
VLLNLKKTAIGDPFSTGEKRMMKHDPNVHDDPLDVEPLRDALVSAGAEVLDTDIDYDRIVSVSDPRLASLAARIRESIDVDVLHFNHLKLAVFDERVSIHGSTNLNFRSLEDDKDFELIVRVEDRRFAAHNLRVVRDVDLRYARRLATLEPPLPELAPAPPLPFVPAVVPAPPPFAVPAVPPAPPVPGSGMVRPMNRHQLSSSRSPLPPTNLRNRSCFPLAPLAAQVLVVQADAPDTSHVPTTVPV